MKNSNLYPCIIKFAGSNCEARFPNIEGIMAFGSTHDEALSDAQKKLEFHFTELKVRGKELPKPAPVNSFSLLNNEKTFVVCVNTGE
ncbi:hypothetical protein bcgnr5378_06420 [Bacillus cereus]|nr:type II toxin-antitoxin system HicB family antitoxin [Bacillus cereus]